MALTAKCVQVGWPHPVVTTVPVWTAGEGRAAVSVTRASREVPVSGVSPVTMATTAHCVSVSMAAVMMGWKVLEVVPVRAAGTEHTATTN